MDCNLDQRSSDLREHIMELKETLEQFENQIMDSIIDVDLVK